MTSRTWCFTWNNYDADSEMRLQNFNYKLMCYGREKAPTTGTPHLQGVLVLREPQRLSYLRSTFGKQAKWLVCESLGASINYCKKDGDYFFDDRRKKRGPKPRTGDPIPRQTVQIDEDMIESILRESIRNVKIS